MTKPCAAHSRKNEPWAEARAWRSHFAPLAKLPGEIRQVLERTGYGCLAAEANGSWSSAVLLL